MEGVHPGSRKERDHKGGGQKGDQKQLPDRPAPDQHEEQEAARARGEGRRADDGERAQRLRHTGSANRHCRGEERRACQEHEKRVQCGGHHPRSGQESQGHGREGDKLPKLGGRFGGKALRAEPGAEVQEKKEAADRRDRKGVGGRSRPQGSLDRASRPHGEQAKAKYAGSEEAGPQEPHFIIHSDSTRRSARPGRPPNCPLPGIARGRTGPSSQPTSCAEELSRSSCRASAFQRPARRESPSANGLSRGSMPFARSKVRRTVMPGSIAPREYASPDFRMKHPLRVRGPPFVMTASREASWTAARNETSRGTTSWMTKSRASSLPTSTPRIVVSPPLIEMSSSAPVRMPAVSIAAPEEAKRASTGRADAANTPTFSVTNASPSPDRVCTLAVSTTWSPG